MARNRSNRPGESEISPGYREKEEKMRLGHSGIALLAAAALLPAAVCCVKIDDMQQEGNVAIAYNTVLEQPRTKAATAYREDVPFKSYAWYLPTGQTWARNKADAVPYFADATISFDGGVWRNTAQHYYWPKKGSLSFRSYSPASIPVAGAAGTDGISVTKDGVSLANWKLNKTTNQDIDFMVADLTSDRTANATTYGYLGVPTLFRHKLAKLTIQASSGSVPTVGQEPKIYKISLKYIFTKGSYTLASEAAAGVAATAESWGSRSETEEIVIFEKSAGQTITEKATVFSGTSGLLVIPQVLNKYTYTATTDSRTVAASIYIEYAYYDTATGGYPAAPSSAEKTFEGIKSSYWAIGHHYTYSLVIGEENEPIEFDAGVADWSDGGSYTIKIGGE